MNPKLKMGIVGGGGIGTVHQMAARLDGKIELVAGAFSSNAERSKRSGEQLGLHPSRVYDDYRAMAAKEAELPADERIDFVSIVTPNHLHSPVAKAFLEAGFNVVCDKPMTFDLAEALELKDLVKKSGKVFALTYNYTGYPMVKEAREIVRRGELGKVLKVVTEYPQGWLLNPLEAKGQEQAWRNDPSKAGATGCLSDIGTHVEHLARYVTGLEIDELCADFTKFGAGQRLEDDANLLVHYKGGARGIIHCSKISAGEENRLNIRAYGTHASLEWDQEHPNELILKYPDASRRTLRRGNEYVSGTAKRVTRLVRGQPEGFIEAFANLYLEAARAIRAETSGQRIPDDCDFPNVEDGVAGMAFVETAVESATNGGAWTKVKGA
ncbi:MAG: Gfo/Idh/MocA family oxidoreductase [Verrucomicrobia bacterium]|nr:Gfo/Idh/MocA family oxidoreductase [Verrucomicrobiota bacterium]